MQIIIDIFTNPCVVACIGGWFCAQVIKTILHAITYKKLDFRRLLGDGGMPSGHTATVTALAIAAVLTVVVCRDAVGVRRETEKQAKMLNKVVDTLEETSGQNISDTPLNTFVGHTPLQIAVGAVIGITVAILLHLFVF